MTALVAVPTTARVVFVMSCGHAVTRQDVAALNEFRSDPSRTWVATGLWCELCRGFLTVLAARKIGRGDL